MAENKGKDKWITVRMEQELFDDLNRRAEAAGMTRSDFVRAVLTLPIYIDDGNGTLEGDDAPIQERMLLTTRSVHALTVMMDRQKQSLNRAGRDLNTIITRTSPESNKHLDAAVNAYMTAKDGYDQLEKIVQEFIEEPKIDVRPRKAGATRRSVAADKAAPESVASEPAATSDAGLGAHFHKAQDYPMDEPYPFDFQGAGDLS